MSEQHITLSVIDPGNGHTLTLHTSIGADAEFVPMVVLRANVTEKSPVFQLGINCYPVDVVIPLLRAVAETLEHAHAEGAIQ